MGTDPIRDLVDIEAIKRLKARYFRCMDEKKWDEWAMVFAREVHMEVPEAAMVVDGRAEVVASVSGVLEGVRTVHHGHMPEIELTGPDTARGVWAMEDYVEFPPSADGSRQGLRGYGHYHEEYVREDGEWRIARLHLARLRIDAL
jgi:hypothetical protein